MERFISLADLQKTVDNAYETYKNVAEGNTDPRVKSNNDKAFGISVMLTDGTVVNRGDVGESSPLGRIATVASHVLLLQQNKPEELVRKSGVCRCYGMKAKKPDIPVSPHGIRAVSAIEPQNDSDGKWDIMIDNIINLAGDAPVLDDALYERLKKALADADTINKLAEAEYTLYDDAASAIDLYARLASLDVTVEQAATIGATIAADGRNPKTGNNAFDGSIAANVVATVARGPHHEGRGWMMIVGIPAQSSFGGLILAILPGFGAIAAYSPELDVNGVSIKAAKAIKYIANTLHLNVYSSARVSVKK